MVENCLQSTAISFDFILLDSCKLYIPDLNYLFYLDGIIIPLLKKAVNFPFA